MVTNPPKVWKHGSILVRDGTRGQIHQLFWFNHLLKHPQITLAFYHTVWLWCYKKGGGGGLLPEFKAKSHGQNLAGTFWMQKFLGKKHTAVANRNFLQQNADAIRKKGGCQKNYVIGFIFWFGTGMASLTSCFLPYQKKQQKKAQQVARKPKNKPKKFFGSWKIEQQKHAAVMRGWKQLRSHIRYWWFPNWGWNHRES